MRMMTRSAIGIARRLMSVRGARRGSQFLPRDGGLELVRGFLGALPMRRDREHALVDLERLLTLVARIEDYRHARKRAEVARLALQGLGDIGHRPLVIVVEPTHG